MLLSNVRVNDKKFSGPTLGGHQRVGVKRALLLLQRLAQPAEVGLMVFFAKEARLGVWYYFC